MEKQSENQTKASAVNLKAKWKPTEEMMDYLVFHCKLYAVLYCGYQFSRGSSSGAERTEKGNEGNQDEKEWAMKIDLKTLIFQRHFPCGLLVPYKFLKCIDKAAHTSWCHKLQGKHLVLCLPGKYCPVVIFCEMWYTKVKEWYISHLSSPHIQTDEMYKSIWGEVQASLNVMKASSSLKGQLQILFIGMLLCGALAFVWWQPEDHS